MRETIPTAASSIGKPSHQSGEQSPVAVCCLISAAMLALADADGHTDEQRAGFRELNKKQAALLRRAATFADDMLDALQDIERGLANTGSDPRQWMTSIRKQDAWGIARAAITKATGADR